MRQELKKVLYGLLIAGAISLFAYFLTSTGILPIMFSETMIIICLFTAVVIVAGSAFHYLVGEMEWRKFIKDNSEKKR